MRGVTLYSSTCAIMFSFQPALPMRGVTLSYYEVLAKVTISTRTPHAGSDPATWQFLQFDTDFNPHSPCGE